MQRLNRLRGDRGAVAVWVAVLMVPMMIVAALAIDIGSLHADRQRLQTGADAAALAIAQQCAGGECGDEDATAQELADANEPQGGPVVADVVELDTGAGYVEVETNSERGLWFGRFAGQTEAVQARAGAASWGSPGGGRSTVPFIFNSCELGPFGKNVLEVDATGAVVGLRPAAEGVTVRLEQTQVSNTTQCGVPNSGNFLPGGFGWLQDDAQDDCTVVTQVDDYVPSGDGGSQAGKCNEWLAAHTGTGEELLLPVFDQARKADKSYRVVGYVAVTLDRYQFQGQNCFPMDPCPSPKPGNGAGWLEVTPVRFVAHDADFETSPTAPDLGAQIVELQLPRGTAP